MQQKAIRLPRGTLQHYRARCEADWQSPVSQPPLIKPDVRNDRIRLSDRLRHAHTQTSPSGPQRVDAQSPEDGLQRELARPARVRRRVTATKEVTDSIVNVAIQT